MTNLTTAPPAATGFGDYAATALVLGGVSVKSVYRLAKFDPSFPRPVKVGRSVRFDLDEVRAWAKSDHAATARTTPAAG